MRFARNAKSPVPVVSFTETGLMQIRFSQSEINRNEPCLLDDLLAVQPVQFVLSVLYLFQKNAALFVLPALDCQPDKSCDRDDRGFNYGSESLWVYSFI